MTPLDPSDWLPSHADYVRVRTEHENERGIRWADQFSAIVRRKLHTVYEDTLEGAFDGYLLPELDEQCYAFLRRHSRVQTRAGRIVDALTDENISDGETADWLAAIPLVIPTIDELWRDHGILGGAVDSITSDVQEFFVRVDDVLLEERVGWLYLHNRFRRRESQPLHLDVIEPMEALLTADPRFAKAERAYGEATNHLAQGSYGSAISLTYSAVQETLQGLGATGGDLGQLFTSAKNKGFLSNSDTQLVQAVKGLLNWLTANRSARGNAHGASSATREDAQFAVHTAAALMLRLMQFPPEAQNIHLE